MKSNQIGFLKNNSRLHLMHDRFIRLIISPLHILLFLCPVLFISYNVFTQEENFRFLLLHSGIRNQKLVLYKWT